MNEVKSIHDGWVETTIKEVGKVITGKTPSKNNPEDWGDLVDFITPTEIKSENKYVFNSPRKLSKKGSERFGKMLLPQKSIIVTCIGSDMGKVVLNKRIALANQQINSILVNEKNSSDFIYYLLKDSYKVLRKKAEGSGSTMPILNKSTFENLQFNIPKDIEEQKSIASILIAFDDKIELLQAQNKTLEETAQTIFKEWFGKYQIGDELPEGWRITTINEFIDSTLGGDYGKENIEDDYDQRTLCLRGTDLPDMKMGTPEKAPIRYLKKSKLERCKLMNGDIVIEISGGTENQSTGRVMYINDIILDNSSLPMTCVNFCRIIRPSKIEYMYFLHSLFDYLYNRKVFFNWENGTTGIKNLNLNAFLEGFLLFIPNNQNKIIEFNNLIESSFIKIQTNNIQIQTLSKTRDELLPRLMSGEIRVNEFKV